MRYVWHHTMVDNIQINKTSIVNLYLSSIKSNVSFAYITFYDHIEIVKLLLSLPAEYGIDPSIFNNSAIRLAFEKG